jgi:hypothetical protein
MDSSQGREGKCLPAGRVIDLTLKRMVVELGLAMMLGLMLWLLFQPGFQLGWRTWFGRRLTNKLGLILRVMLQAGIQLGTWSRWRLGFWMWLGLMLRPGLRLGFGLGFRLGCWLWR